MGQFGPHLHHSAFDGATVLRVGCSCAWGSIFMGGLELVGVMVLLVGGINQSFHNSIQRGSLRFFLPQAIECYHKLGCFLVVGDCSLEYLLLKASDPLNSLGPYGLLEVVAQLHCWNWAWPLPLPSIFLWESISSSFQLLWNLSLHRGLCQVE